jgi:RNA polymerase sigma-70 factor (ECF subfamily)
LDFRKIQAGHESSVRELASIISTWVFGTVMSTLKNSQDAEEVVQDTVLKAIEVIMEDNDTIISVIEDNAFKPWVFRIAINKAKDKLKFNQQKKRSHLHQALSLDDNEFSISAISDYRPDEQMIGREKQAYLMWCIDQLPVSQREAIHVVKIEGNTVNDAAYILQTSSKAVESLLSRAKENLRKIMDKSKDN